MYPKNADMWMDTVYFRFTKKRKRFCKQARNGDNCVKTYPACFHLYAIHFQQITCIKKCSVKLMQKV